MRVVARRSLRAAALLSLPGLLLAALSAVGFFPMANLAAALAADGHLSDDYQAVLRSSQWWLAGLLALLGPMILGAGRWPQRFWRAATDLPLRTFTAWAAAAALLAALLLHFALFDGIPHLTDEISHLFQAKILLTGRIYADAPPCYAQFAQEHIYITSDGRWFSIYPPGHALLLAAFQLVHALHLVGPTAFALALAAFVWLVNRFFGGAAARLAGLLFLLSPLNLLLAATYMSHMTFLCCFLAGIVLLLLPSPARSPLLCALNRLPAGLLLGQSAIIRPQDFVVLAAVTGLAWLLARRPWRGSFLVAALQAAPGALVPLGVLLFWNDTLYGTPWSLGYAHGSAQPLTHMLVPRFGFDADFTPATALSITGHTLLRLNKVLLGWPSSLLPLLLLPFVTRLRRQEVVCLAGFAAFVAFYFPYFYFGHEYEARFYHPGAPFLIALTARALLGLADRCDARGASGRDAVAALTLLFSLHGLLHYFPSYLWPRYRHDYEQVTPVVERLVDQERLTNAVVLLPSPRHRYGLYGSGFRLNDPDLAGAVVYARDPGDELACLTNAFPGRSFYRYLDEPAGAPARLLRIDAHPDGARVSGGRLARNGDGRHPGPRQDAVDAAK
jgi:hypothetical protein